VFKVFFILGDPGVVTQEEALLLSEECVIPGSLLLLPLISLANSYFPLKLQKNKTYITGQNHGLLPELVNNFEFLD